MPRSSSSNGGAARESLAVISSRVSQRRREEREQARRIVPRLAARAYHLPGNNWCQDWWQYMTNNHPVVGICLHNKLHPLDIGQRIIILIGSIAFGLAATNFVFLWYAFDREEDMDDTVFKISFLGNSTSIEEDYKSVEITRGMIALWTFGGAVHSIFDLTIWYISACACCHAGGMCAALGCCKKVGSYLVVAIVMVTVALATFVVVWRASQESQEQYEQEKERAGFDDDSYPTWGEIRGVSSFSFLIGYAIEVALAWAAYYPLLGTILFSGILGCGTIPFLGGRPLEVRREQKMLKRNGGCSQTSGESFDDEYDCA